MIYQLNQKHKKLFLDGKITIHNDINLNFKKNSVYNKSEIEDILNFIKK